VNGVKDVVGKSQLAKHLESIKPQSNTAVLLLLGLPWVLALNNNIWLFDLHFTIDPWVYLGFMLHLPEYLSTYYHTYYSTRLPWLLPGHLTFSLLPPLVAQYVLHIGFYYLAIFSLFWLLQRLFDRRTALLTATMMGCYSWFLTAIGTNYVDGAGIAYYSATAWMVVLATQTQRWRIFAFLSGVFGGLTIFCNLTWASLIPPLIFLYFFLNRVYRKNPILLSLGLGIAGLLTTLIGLGAINYAFNQRFLFFQSSLNAASQLLFVMNAPWHGNLLAVLPNASWIILLISTVAASLMLLVIRRFQPTFPMSATSLGIHLFFLLSFGIFVLLEVNRISTFQYYYYTSYLIPATFMAIAAQISQFSQPLNRLKPLQFAWAIAGIIAITLIAFRLPTQFQVLRYQALTIMLGLSGVWIIMGGLGVWQRDRPSIMGRGVLVWLLSTFLIANVISITFLSPIGFSMNTIGNQAERYLYPSLHQRHEAFLAAVQAQRVLQKVNPTLQFIFWYDYHESLIYRSISSMSLWQRVGDETFPATGAENGSPEEVQQAKALLEQNPNVVILSQQSNAFDQARASLNKLGLDAKLVQTYPIQQGPISFNMTFIQVQKLS
jgi:hypothetical protein